MADTATVWRSPAGRLHSKQRCSGNGQPRNTTKIRITRDEYEHALAEFKVCMCLRWIGPRFTKEEK